MKLPSKIKFSDEKIKGAFEKLSNSTKDEKMDLCEIVIIK